MFSELVVLLNKSKDMKLSNETEILLGYYEKPKSVKDRIKKLIRKYGK